MTSLYIADPIAELLTRPCPDCGGEGRLEIDTLETCRHTGSALIYTISCGRCDGRGVVEDEEGLEELEERCDD